MKFLAVFATLVLAISAATDQELWAEFKAKHGRVYNHFRQEKLRFQIFQQSLRTIEEHNARYEKGEVSYYKGITQFADKTQEEFRSLLTFKTPNLENTKVFKPQVNYTAPDTIDWRDKGAVLEVKNQGQCGGCWAFSTTGSLEGQIALKHGKKISLSEQELLDCSTNGNAGCNGGVMEYAFDYISENGISTETAYPYVAVDGRCQRNAAARADVKLVDYTEVGQSETALKTAAGSAGPISVGINADLLSSYAGGVFNEPSCKKSLDHGVLVVGYGTEGGLDYWLIKNSWGKDWGDNGYFKLIRNANQQCGIGNWNVYPNIE